LRIDLNEICALAEEIVFRKLLAGLVESVLQNRNAGINERISDIGDERRHKFSDFSSILECTRFVAHLHDLSRV